jgi:hypothetical protein
MKFFKNIIDQVFPRPEAIASGKETIDSGPINRNNTFKTKYHQWIEGERWIWMNSIISTAYNEALIKGGNSPDIALNKANGIQGMIIRNTLEATREEFQFLLDLLKEKSLSLDYMFYRGITESREKNGRIRIKEEYYLKPRPSSMELPVSQGYGNITLQLNIINEDVLDLRIIVNTYAGFNYQEPKPFEELISHYFPAN